MTYEEADEAIKLSPVAEREHAEYVREVAEDAGFPLSDWTPSESKSRKERKWQ